RCDDHLLPRSKGRAQDGLCSRNVCADGAERVLDYIPDADRSGQMKDNIAFLDQALDNRGVENTVVDESEAGLSQVMADVLDPPCGQIVEAADLIPAPQKLIDEIGPHKTSAPRYECPHRHPPTEPSRGLDSTLASQSQALHPPKGGYWSALLRERRPALPGLVDRTRGRFYRSFVRYRRHRLRPVLWHSWQRRGQDR